MLVLMILSIMGGWMAFKNMRQELQPDVSFGVITVSTVYPGAGPDEVATLISRRIEEALSGIQGLNEVTSTSQEGISTVVGQFEVGTDMTEALNDARAKVDRIVPFLPQGVEKPSVSKVDTGTDPVLRLVLKNDKMSSRDLRDLADDKIKDRFARIPGVAVVNVSGGDVREIQIQVKKDRLLAYDLGIVDVLRAVQASTLNVPSGRVISGDQEFAVRVLGEFKTVEDVQNMTLSIDERGNNGPSKSRIVRLGDIADIRDSVVERRSYSRLNGNDAVSMSIQKAKEGNAIEIVKAATAVIEGLNKDFGIDAEKTFNQAEQIEESLFDLGFALFFGIFLVTIIVYVFLHNLRGTLIVGIAIPLCLFLTLIVLKALGFTINNMSMLALSLAIGVLVDDAIVVLENIFRHLKGGEDPVEAAIAGRSEIGLAAIAITLADVVVFLPIATMGGVVGQFFKPLGIGFAVCTLISLFVSFTITPMLASRWFRKGEDVEHFTKGFPLWFENNFKRLENMYRHALEWALNHRWFVFISGFVALIGVFMFIGGSFASTAVDAVKNTIGMVMICSILGVITFAINAFRKSVKPQRILYGILFGLCFPIFALAGFGFGQWKKESTFKFGFFPPSDSGAVSVTITLPSGSSLSATERIAQQVEQIVMKHPETKYVLTDIGERGGGGGFSVGETGTNFAEVSVTLHDKSALLDKLMFWKKHEEQLRDRSDTSVAADMLEDIGKIPGAEVTVAAGSNFGFGAPIQMSFVSDDRELLTSTVTKIKQLLLEGAIKGVVSPDISSRAGKPEIRAVPDRVRLADAGITPADVANTMRVLYEGDDTTKFRVRGKEYDIRVMMNVDDRNRLSSVTSVPITYSQGNPVFLDQIAQIQSGVGLDKISRRNRQDEIQLSANLLPGFAAGSVQQEIDNWLKNEKLVPEEVKVIAGGQASVQARETGYLMMALLTGLILVYFLLASLYENLLYPFIIQLAQPQAMVGAILALVIFDKTLNIVGFVGIIALVGLVGKNAILLVDYTNTLRARGQDRHDALLKAGPTRLRPIMMTTLALILGMLPVALAIGRGSEFRETIGYTIIGGITLSTFLTLLVIPCSYTIFDDMYESIKNMRKKRVADLDAMS